MFSTDRYVVLFTFSTFPQWNLCFIENMKCCLFTSGIKFLIQPRDIKWFIFSWLPYQMWGKKWRKWVKGTSNERTFLGNAEWIQSDTDDDFIWYTLEVPNYTLEFQKTKNEDTRALTIALDLNRIFPKNNSSLPSLQDLCENEILSNIRIDNAISNWKIFNRIGVSWPKKHVLAKFISEHLKEITNKDKECFQDTEMIKVLLDVINYQKEELANKLKI